MVPILTLLTYATINNYYKFVKDRTVWTIDSYKDNYVFGTVYATVNENSTSKTEIVGSIIPFGDVSFAFILTI